MPAGNEIRIRPDRPLTPPTNLFPRVMVPLFVRPPFDGWMPELHNTRSFPKDRLSALQFGFDPTGYPF